MRALPSCISLRVPKYFLSSHLIREIIHAPLQYLWRCTFGVSASVDHVIALQIALWGCGLVRRRQISCGEHRLKQRTDCRRPTDLRTPSGHKSTTSDLKSSFAFRCPRMNSCDESAMSPPLAETVTLQTKLLTRNCFVTEQRRAAKQQLSERKAAASPDCPSGSDPKTLFVSKTSEVWPADHISCRTHGELHPSSLELEVNGYS
ncbi:hypothetical protein K491DRAFT_256312 [Lophiostoma macrostomum CBS 122681]|uniref:Uncharacterized protein n=1 Tax=Lophiostoma macrostomum CBS 122681 TaxID=1314788 RepID=A0A6A6SL58_9PLEO|nr:hypothetical protein K491DRAFT_256312 [Lophiostoma macrostomum CBS 122681]